MPAQDLNLHGRIKTQTHKSPALRVLLSLPNLKSLSLSLSRLHFFHSSFSFLEFQSEKLLCFAIWKMESAEQSTTHSKRSPRRRSSNGHISMSDTESTTSQADSWHSPLRFESPLRSDEASFRPEEADSPDRNTRAIVLVDKYSSPLPSPKKSNFPAIPPAEGQEGRRPHSEKPTSENLDLPANPPVGKGKDDWRQENLDVPSQGNSPVVVGLNKMVREEAPPRVKKVGVVRGGGGLEEGYGREDEVGGERRSRAAVASILKRSERNVATRKLALGFRVFEMIACLVSFSVMAADRTQGWSGDSFDRYIEYR